MCDECCKEAPYQYEYIAFVLDTDEDEKPEDLFPNDLMTVFAKSHERARELALFEAHKELIDQYGEDEARDLLPRLRVQVRRFA